MQRSSPSAMMAILGGGGGGGARAEGFDGSGVLTSCAIFSLGVSFCFHLISIVQPTKKEKKKKRKKEKNGV